ncbi:hypothetical protein ONJ16_27620, partial [Salmonella enterica subsp. enterica serovar Montevideo]|nr:hypothetical protein [Salmonella enterica subsp. enterica serovar Montevideo]
IQQLRVPDAGIENLQERRYWLQCERAYTYQPIYQTDGRLMAVDQAKNAGKAVHIMGLLSAGGVHSHEDHIMAMVELAAERGA